MNTDRRIRISNILFTFALVIELAFMILEKSEFYFDFESYVFRVTFLITLASVLIKPHSKKEWAIYLLIWAFTFICYRISGKNDLLRVATFVMAARDIDLSKTMKAMFYICVAGFGAIALLSITGIYGPISYTADYGRVSGEELRYVFGFGHPNTLYGAVFALTLLWIWIYGKRAKIWEYILIFALNMAVCYLAATRTGYLISIFTVFLGIISRYMPKLSEKKWPFVVATFVSPVFCVAFSVFSACVAYIPYYEFEHKLYDFVNNINSVLNDRIENLYRANNRHAGAIVSWKLFSDRLSEEYFDMGWVRIFYWYGIIPAILIIALVVVFIYICYKKKDLFTLTIILSMSVYTVIEATFVSRYIGRNLILPILGVYLAQFMHTRYEQNGSE